MGEGMGFLDGAGDWFFHEDVFGMLGGELCVLQVDVVWSEEVCGVYSGVGDGVLVVSEVA